MEKKKRPNDCCNIDDNMIKYMERPELAVEECKICGCKHRRLIVERAIFKTTQENSNLNRSEK